MKLPQKEYPSKYINKSNFLSDKSVNLPFQLLQCGFSNDKELNFDVDYSAFIIFYLLEGVVQYHKHKEIQYIHPEHIIISSCNTKLRFYRATPNVKYFYLIFSGSHAKLYYNMIRSKRGVIPISPLHNIASYFTTLCSRNFTSDLFFQMEACYIIHQIIHELLVVTHEIEEARLLTPVQQTIVNTALKYIDKHYKDELSVDIICQKVNFSKFYFCKIFKEHTGKTLYQYLTEYRINKSKEYLTYSKLSIHSIATKVGFKNPLTYSRCFKKLTDMTPSEYRENF